MSKLPILGNKTTIKCYKVITKNSISNWSPEIEIDLTHLESKWFFPSRNKSNVSFSFETLPMNIINSKTIPSFDDEP